jgi:COP9 signalosome complex subunit 5
MKMLKHSLAGVKKGRAKGGMPIEVMGLLIGKPEGETIVVLDAAPIPVEGIEYKVEASAEATNFMANLQDSMEDVRKERYVTSLAIEFIRS